MQPLKDNNRHGAGVGVEMTMSLSGPPGLHRHTTLPTDSIYHYMNRQQPQQTELQHKLLLGGSERKTPVTARVTSMDLRLGNHDSVALSRDHRLGAGHEIRPTTVELTSHDAIRGVHDHRGVEILGTKESGRIISEHHNQQMPQPHSHHLGASRKYSDVRSVMVTHDKTSITEPVATRDAVQLGQSLGSSRPGSSHSSQQSQLSLQDPRMPSIPMTGVYSFELQSPYSTQMAMNSMISTGVQRKPGNIQLSPSGSQQSLSASVTYPVQNSGRSGDNIVTSGIHPLHGHDTTHPYVSTKQAGIYQEEYSKAVTTGHFLPELMKAGSVGDVKQLGQHQVISQHRDLIRESHPDYSDPHYNPGARSIANPAMEVTSLSKHANDASHTVTSRTAIDDQVQKPASFMNTHAPLFSKGHQSQSSISKSMAYQPGSESISRSGQEPFTSISHLQNSSNISSAQQHSMYPPSQLHQDNIGSFSDPELHPSVHLHKSPGVIRPPVHASDERIWQEGYHPLAKQTGPIFHQDDLLSHGSKNCIPHHHDLDSSHPPLHPTNTIRMQGSISTGQPRIMYDSGNSKSVPYSDLLSPPSAERYTVSQKEVASARPSSVGRSTQLPQNISVIPREDRSFPDLSEKSTITAGGLNGSSVSGISGAAALDLTKLHTGTRKPVDSPLDLTVKTKKRRVDDHETPEYDRMLCAAKRQKLDTGSPRSGISCQKIIENPPNAIWLSSPSPRGPENYEHRSVPLTIYSSHTPSTPTLTRPHKYGQSHLSDGRTSADQRISRDRLSADSLMNRDGCVSVESRSSLDHQTLSLTSSQSKMYSSSMIPDMVRHSTGTNPPMVPLTTQLQKVKEEQAFQMKLQRMSNDTVVNAHTDSKQVYKDTLSSRHLELASQSPNEVVVVRHSQQHYDISEQTQQSHSQHSFIKQQQQQQCLDVQQMQQTHHHQKLLNNQQEIIELGMKDSSDPLQASRASTFNLRGFTSQPALLQQSQQHHLHQQQQTCVVQQHKYSSKEPQQQLSAYSHQQQVLYSKEAQQQSYTKEQLQFLSQQHYSRTQYSSKRGEDMDYFYHKQQQQFPSRKRNDVDGYKQTLSASQSNFAGTQKWGMSQQQRPSLKSAYPHAQPSTSTHGDYRGAKLPAVYSRSPSHARMSSGREYDGYRYGYVRSDRLKLSDSQKSSLPQIAGPLPAGGVREESRRALSRRVSYSGSSVSGTLITDSNKQLDNIRKKSTSSLPERIDTAGKSEVNHGKSGTSVSRVSEKSAVVVEDSKLNEIKSVMSPTLVSQAIPLPNAGSGVIPDLLSNESLSSQSAAQFVVPLSLTIPQTPSPLTSSTPSPAGASSSRPASSHKAWSRKHMILNAVNQDESLKRIICSNGSKHESGGISSECKNRIIASSTCSPIPTSPKMPILSPQDDDDGEVASEEQGVRKQAISDDPPTLDPSHMGQTKPIVSRSLSLSQAVVGATGAPATQNQTCSSGVIPENPHTKDAYRNSSHEVFNSNNSSFTNTSNSIVAKEISATKSDEISVNAIVVRRCTIGNTLPDQQIQQQHEESQKIQPGSVQFQRAEVIRRNSLAGHGLGPWGHMKNIPIANVAPFIHSRDDDDKSKQQKLDDQQQIIQQNSNFPNSDSMYILTGQTQEAPKEVMSKPDIPKQNASTELVNVDIKHGTDSPEKDDSNQPAFSSNKNDSRKKKVTKLRVSSPTKMKELELISPTLEYAVLKSTDMEDIKILDKLSHGSLRKSLESRMKYKHKIVREKNSLIKPKKTAKKRIQYVFDDDEEEDEPEPVAIHNENDDNDEDFEIEGANKGGKNSTKTDAEAKARDREERALRREQLRDQSEENTSRHLAATASSHGQTSRSSSGNKNRTRSKESLTSEKQKPAQIRPPKTASRISRRRMSSTNQRAQELKHNALVQRRKTGKRKIRRYNRNAAYEQELHREANRRAVVRAKRQASSKARERLQQQRDLSHDADNDDNLLDETWKLPETKGNSASGRKNHQHISSKHIGVKASSKSHSTSHSNKTSASSSASLQHKEDYESDVENVPDDLAAEMASDDNGGKKKKLRVGKCRGRREDNDKDTIDGQDTSGLEDDPDYEDDSRHNVMSSIPIEIVPVPADVRKLTINKNSGETLLHRAARIGHEEITLYCLKTQIVNVNARDNAGYTPLHESCVRGSVAVARHLIYHGADVNCCSQDGIRPIHDAIENDHMEVVRLLLVHGADPLIATYAGRTPLRIARSLLMLQTLQGHIADLNGWPGVEEEEEDDDREEDEVVSWRFTLSLTFLESSQIDSYTPCLDMPDDPPDDSSDVFDDGPTSAINVFNLALDGEDRTPQPFCLLDEVINRLNMSEDKLTSLFPWKPTSMTLSSERVREVASCCCSNVSIRLPQSGKVTLLLFSTLNKIEYALKQQMKMKVKKEEGNTGNKEVVKKINSSSCVPILTRLEQANSFLEDELEHRCLKETALKNVSSSSCLSSKQKVKLSDFSSIFQSASTSVSASLATSSTSASSLNSSISGIAKTSRSQSSSHSWPSSSSEQQSNKKTSGGHHNRHHHHQQKQHPQYTQHQHSQQRSSSGVAGEVSLPIKAAGSTSKDARSSSSSGSVPRKSKKEDCDNQWLNTPMFSDDSSSSPFHTGLDYFDSDNSI